MERPGTLFLLPFDDDDELCFAFAVAIAGWLVFGLVIISTFSVSFRLFYELVPLHFAYIVLLLSNMSREAKNCVGRLFVHSPIGMAGRASTRIETFNEVSH